MSFQQAGQENPSQISGYLIHRRHSTNQVAPVQRLNFDVLLEIFKYAWVNDTQDQSNRGVMPQQILSSVCRRWREIALSEPGLWARLPRPEFGNETYINLILQRSHPLPLHVELSKRTHEAQRRILSTVTNRMKCLKAEDECVEVLFNSFPVLERLYLLFDHDLVYLQNELDNYLFDVSRFPRIRELHWSKNGLSLNSFILAAQRLPPLKVLSMNSFSPRGRLVVNRCSNTLVSLSLHIRESTRDTAGQIDFPHLRQLLITESDLKTKKRLLINAPHLQSVFHGTFLGSSHVELELQYPQAVQEIYLWKASMNLASYPGLRNLWIQTNGACLKFVKVTLEGINRCSDLNLIRYACDFDDTRSYYEGVDEMSIKTVIMNTIETSGHRASVEKFDPEYVLHPGAVTCSVYCHTMCRIWSP